MSTNNSANNSANAVGVSKGAVLPPCNMAKSRKQQLIQELLELEQDDLGKVGQVEKAPLETPLHDEKSAGKTLISMTENESSICKPKKQLTEKQIEALKKGQEKRNENRERNRLIKEQQEEEERKAIEEKMVKKAIAIKKKQIKKQALLDEISDDDEGAMPPSNPHIQKPKAGKPSAKLEVSPAPPSLPAIRFV